MGVPGATGHQQHRLVFEVADGSGHVQRIGHHHQAGLAPQFGDHGCRGAAAVDDDARMFADTPDGGTRNGFLVGRHRLGRLTEQFLRHRYRTAIAPQQQAIGFEGSEVFANGHFRSFETLGQGVHAHLTLFAEQSQDIVPPLGCISFRHLRLSFVSKDNGCNQNLTRSFRQAVAALWIVLSDLARSHGITDRPIKKPTYSHKSAFDRSSCG